MAEFQVDVTPAVSWLPSTARVAAKLRTRVLERVGEAAAQEYIGYVDATETADFTDSTRPTAEEASDLIEDAAAEAQGIVGEPCPQPLARLATRLTTLRACADIEATYFPRQTSRDQTANEYWDKRADKVSEQLTTLAAGIGGGDEPGPADNTGLMAGAFPPSSLSVVGPCGYAVPRPI